MGYTTDKWGVARSYEPDDNKQTINIRAHYCDVDFEDILERCQEKWPGCKLDELSISADHVHTDCIGYDRYDPSDYTNYLVITISVEYFERIKKRSSDEHDPFSEITLKGSFDLEDLMSAIQSKWPGIKMDEIEIYSSATSCMGHADGDAETCILAKTSYFDRITAPEVERDRNEDSES